MHRRQFLQSGLSLGGLMLLGSLEALADTARPSDRMVVAVHLAGGNDGLNTVVPWADARYRKARPSLALSGDDLWQPGGPLGFNRALEPLRPLWDAGHMAVVNGVGYPRPVRSHFKAAEIWQTGTPGSAAGSGWLGRTLEEGGGTGVSVETPINRSLWSERRPALAVGPADSFRMAPVDSAALAAIERMYRNPHTDGHLSSTWDGLQKALRVVHGQKPAGLPNNDRGHALEAVLAFMPTARLAHLTMGGFDTHSGQRPRQAKALKETAEALAAFWRAVQARGLADRTLVLVYSEFGRRVEENASGGTDHGAAGPLFLLGSGVKGGWYGQYPSLGDLEDGDLRYAVDFRSVYASILEGWLGQRSRPVLGEAFPTLSMWA